MRIFLSFDSDDLEWVAEFRTALEGRGHRVFTFDRQRPGDDWVERLFAEIESSEAGILVLTNAYSGQPWCKFELKSLLRKKEAKQSYPLIPITRADAPIPRGLGSIIAAKSEDPDLLGIVTRKLEQPDSILDEVVPNLGLRRVILSVAAIALAIPIVTGVGASANSWNRTEQAKAIQRQIQLIDERIASGGATVIVSPNTLEHRDGVTSEMLAVDTWRDDHLFSRNFFSQGNLIAQDEFLYVDDENDGKLRSYVDADQRVFLVDRFLQDGTLVRKRVCPQGPERPCDVLIDDMRSPLPEEAFLLPPRIVSYR